MDFSARIRYNESSKSAFGGGTVEFKGKVAVATGENICIDGGMTRRMIYRNDCGRALEE